MQLSDGETNYGRIKLREHYWQNVLISLVYGPTDAFSCDQLLLDTLVSLTSNNDDVYRSFVARLDYAARLLEEGGYKFRTRLPDLIAKYATETANLPENTVPSPRVLEPGEYMSLTDPATAINSSPSKKKVNPEKGLTGSTRQKILRNSGTQESERDERNPIQGSSTKRNSSSSKKKAGPEKTLIESAQQKVLKTRAYKKRGRSI